MESIQRKIDHLRAIPKLEEAQKKADRLTKEAQEKADRLIEEAQKMADRLKAVIACLLVILAIGILLVIIRFTRLMILEPIEQPATEAFRVLLRALNGLSHCPLAFAQYFNAPGQQ